MVGDKYDEKADVFSYGMVLDEAADGDQVFEAGGVKVIVDPMSMRYLEGAEVDYKEDLMGGGFAMPAGFGGMMPAGMQGGKRMHLDLGSTQSSSGSSPGSNVSVALG